MLRYWAALIFTAWTLAGARTLVAHIPDLDGDGVGEKAYAIEWPEPPAPMTPERRVTVTTEVGGVAVEPYVIDFLNVNTVNAETVQTFTAMELTPRLIVIYVVYRRMYGASAGWEDVGVMLAPQDGHLASIWEEVVANWSAAHGGFELEVSFDDVGADGTPEIATWGVGTVDVGVDEKGERVYEDYTINRKLYRFDEDAGRYVLHEECGD